MSLSDLLVEVNRRWLSTLDLEKIVPEVVSVTQAAFRADDVSLLLVDPNGKELVEHVIVSRRRAPDNRFRIRIQAEGITGWVASHRQSQFIEDVTRDKRYICASTRIQSEAALPILAGDRLLGVLNIEWTEHRAFDAETRGLLELLASQIAIALINAESHDRERKRGRQLLILHHLSRIGGGAIPPEAYLARAIEAVRKEFGCHYSSIFLGDYDQEVLVLLAQSYSDGLEMQAGSRQPFGNGLIGNAFKVGETLNVHDVKQNPLYDPKIPETQSEVCVPIRVGDRCLGILDAQSRQLDAFDSDDVVFLETVARFLVPALQIHLDAKSVG